ncbi:MAG: CoA pyrophosphatase [Usitatibacteraceae bacterium]
MLPKDFNPVVASTRAVLPTAERIERDALAAWLAHPHGIGQNSDAGFADDGEAEGLQNQVAPQKSLKSAAVLILVINRPQAQTVLFTQRTAHLTDHAGQISFPGGRVEDHDPSVEHTALRETVEETGVDGSRIALIGSIPRYTTGTGYLITPVVGWLEPPVEYRPDPTEVEECFEVPLDFLIAPENHRLESAMYKGRMRQYYSIPYGQRYIWGATAGMLVTFTRVLANARGLSFQRPVRMAPDSG